MDAETVGYLGGSTILILVILVGTGNYGVFSWLMIVLSMMALFLVLVLVFADFLILPFISSLFGIEVILSREDKASRSQNAVIKRSNELYYATGYITANVYKYVFAAESVIEGEETGMADASDKWERIVMNTNFPFKFNAIAAAQDVQKYREDLEGQRGFFEFQLSKEQEASNPNTLTIRELQRKVNIVQARIDRISQGELPVNSIMYIETTAVGVSEKEASDLLTNQLNHLQTVFNAFDLSMTRIIGRELHMLYGLNYRLLELEELQRIFQAQK